MANNTAQYGFRPYQSSFASGNLPIEVKSVATGYQAQDDASGFSVSLRKGDPVSIVTGGGVELANGSAAVYGIIAFVKPYWDGEVMKPSDVLPGGTAWGTVESRISEVGVVPAECCLWEIDADENTTAATLAAYRLIYGNNFDHQCLGDTTSAEARPTIEMGTVDTTASLTWRFVKVSDTAENKDFTGTRVKLVVKINDGQSAGHAATKIAGI